MESQAAIFFELLHATALVRGEGEEVFPLLVDALHGGHVGKPVVGVAWDAKSAPPVALVRDVDRLPFPARHLLENNRYRPSLRRNVFDGPITAVYLSRGCPYHCASCVSPLLRSRRVARRSEDNLFGEIRECLTQFNISGFIFYDDCLFLKSKKLNQQVQTFCRSLRSSVGVVKWEMELRCDAVAALNAASLRELRTSGCVQINMGIEKASDQHLKALDKHLSTGQIVAACRNVRTIVPDVRLAGTFILGGPGETEADINELISFARRLDLDFAHFYPLEAYPGTPFFAQMTDGMRPTDWAGEMLLDDRNHWGEILYETKQLPRERLLELTHRAYSKFYRRPEWVERFERTTSVEVRSMGLKVVDRWCEGRFHLAPDEAEAQS
jgi:radical SAM superfamily enzyme YgiQ (UPF0313 family)